MLYVTATNDLDCLNSLNMQIFGKNFDGGVGYVLYEEDVPVGVAKLGVTEEVSCLFSIGILPGRRQRGLGDFFTRVLMDRATTVSDRMIINYQDDYFLKFGFTKADERMQIDSEAIKFPSSCHKN